MPQLWFAASHEQFPPSSLLAQGVAAERAGFDGLGCSDHFAPWFPEGESGNAWVFLGALGQATTKPFGTGVTGVVHRYHPGVIAQAFMSLEELFPGRVFLGTGSGESLNETPLGVDWPSPAEQIERLDSGLEAIRRLWDGETVTMDAGWFRLKEAKLYTRARTRPKLYVSAFGPQAAEVAAKHGDGLWTLGDPQAVSEVVEAWRSAGGSGEVILHSGFGWAADELEALRGSLMWKPTQLSEVYRDDISDPAVMQSIAAEKVTDEQFAKEGFIVGSDPDFHAERIRAMVDLDPTVICLQNISGADPLGAIATYGDHVLPAVRAT